MSETKLLRDVINPKTIYNLSELISGKYKNFDSHRFIEDITPNLASLSLTERLDLVTDALKETLPTDFSQAAQILVNSLPPEPTNEKSSLDGVDLGDENGFIIVALTNYIARYGLDFFDISMNALFEMTKRFSSEGAIRHFIVQNEKKVLELYREWAVDDNVHVRRLVSESLRPRLPWTIRLQNYVEEPQPIIEFLQLLKDDPELYVRRSVANNLNDISKDSPKVVTDLLKKWSSNKSPEMKWLIKHALRTLIKAGDRDALAILGYRHDASVDASHVVLSSSSIKLGDTLEFFSEIVNTGDQTENLVIDFVIYHKKANGKQVPKVFKLKNCSLTPGTSLTINKKHPMKKISTRVYYAGEHALSLKINGKEFEKVSFDFEL